MYIRRVGSRLRLGKVTAVVVPAVLVAIAFLSPGQSFGQIAAGQAKFLGSAGSPPIPSNFDLYWNQITPGNEGKWGTVAGSPDTSTWNWSGLDTVYDYAMENGLLFKEHNLVWGQQQPSWISSLDSAQQYQAVVEWIRLCAEHCPDAAMVDVVNEPLEDVPGGLNPIPYYNALGGAGATGWDWMITAFTIARKYFPKAKLLLNDYYILSSNLFSPGSRVYQYRHMINLLKQRDLIDGIGCEAHFLEGVDSSTIRANLDTLATTGLPIYISEYDVNESNDAMQLSIYQQQFPVFWTDPDVKGITLWGYTEEYVWRPDAYLIRSDGTARPALQWLISYVADNPAGIKTAASVPPSGFSLSQNYPNPFNPTTVIDYQLPEEGPVTLRVYDILGKIVATLADRVESPGSYQVKFDGSRFASGVYFYRLEADGNSITKNFVLMK